MTGLEREVVKTTSMRGSVGMRTIKINRVMRVLSDQRGQSMIEYAVIIGVVIVMAVTLVIIFGGQIEALFNSVTAALSAI